MNCLQKLEQWVILHFFNVQKPSTYWILSKDQERLCDIQHVRKWYKKFKSGRKNVMDKSPSRKLISVTDKTLENNVDTIIRCIEKQEYPTLRTKWMQHMVLFRILLQTEISKNTRQLDNAYADGKSRFLSKRRERISVNRGATITYWPGSSFHQHGSTNICHMQWEQGQKQKTSARKVMLMLFFDVSRSIIVKWTPKGITINAPQYGNTEEVAYKQRKIKGRNPCSCTTTQDPIRWDWHSRCWQHWNSKFSCIQHTARILADVIIKFLVHWRNFWRLNVFLLTKRSKKWSRSGCYKLERNFGEL